ncbi:hypothetical protein LXL04_031704 [Taraxacum kok-saghyz]
MIPTAYAPIIVDNSSLQNHHLLFTPRLQQQQPLTEMEMQEKNEACYHQVIVVLIQEMR